MAGAERAHFIWVNIEDKNYISFYFSQSENRFPTVRAGKRKRGSLREYTDMATISVENAVVKGHHVYLSEVRIGDIFDCFPEVNNLHDPHAMIVMNAGNVVGHLPEGFAEHIHSLFAELKENITVLW